MIFKVNSHLSLGRGCDMRSGQSSSRGSGLGAGWGVCYLAGAAKGLSVCGDGAGCGRGRGNGGGGGSAGLYVDHEPVILEVG